MIVAPNTPWENDPKGIKFQSYGGIHMEEQQSLEIANFRYRLIAPIVSRIDLPPGQIQALIGEAARKTYQIPTVTGPRSACAPLSATFKLTEKKALKG